MKYIKEYESFLDKFRKTINMYKDVSKSVKSAINNISDIKKLSTPLTKLLNDIYPDKKFIYEIQGTDCWIKTTSGIKFISVDTTYGGKINVTLHFHGNDILMNFFFKVFGTDIITVDIDKNDIQNIISQLNIDNYNKIEEEYKIKKDTDKYNL